MISRITFIIHVIVNTILSIYVIKEKCKNNLDFWKKHETFYVSLPWKAIFFETFTCNFKSFHFL